VLITRGQLLFDVDAVLLFQAAQRIRRLNGGFSAEAEKVSGQLFCESIGMPPIECQPVLEAMVKKGWLKATGSNEYLLERPFIQLAAGRIGTPLSRAKAEALLRRIVSEAKAINRESKSDSAFVTELAVFGSYLNTDKAELGDIDIGVRTQPRPREPGTPRKRIDWRAKGTDEIAKTRLKGRSPFVSLHMMEELESAAISHRMVYTLATDLPEPSTRLRGMAVTNGLWAALHVARPTPAPIRCSTASPGCGHSMQSQHRCSIRLQLQP
jgi:predicted nucleotidyltransferase